MCPPWQHGKPWALITPPFATKVRPIVIEGRTLRLNDTVSNKLSGLYTGGNGITNLTFDGTDIPMCSGSLFERYGRDRWIPLVSSL